MVWARCLMVLRCVYRCARFSSEGVRRSYDKKNGLRRLSDGLKNVSDSLGKVSTGP